ncbi:unnamed protein product [Cyclocybe aegerita]|uniref:Uncharacterized protein n=1 Tax=Cyclocybe aegerita TaxID=1973307 RepID=A0A8S0VVG7_CYCAE|nr:unnamed protein product [Cyclocybe aegerita]
MRLLASTHYCFSTGLTLPIFPFLFLRPSSAFTVNANVTDFLRTCDAWALTVDGGTPPYSFDFFSLSSGESQLDFHDTLEAGLTRYIYVNRADPGSTLLVGLFVAYKKHLRKGAETSTEAQDAPPRPSECTRSLELKPVGRPTTDNTTRQNNRFLTSPRTTYHSDRTMRNIRNVDVDPGIRQDDQYIEETERPPSSSSQRTISRISSRISSPPPELPPFTFGPSPRLSDNSFLSPAYRRQIQGTFHLPSQDVPIEPALSETDGVLTRLPSISLSTHRPQSP